MRILFFTVRWVLRHFDDVVVELAERGHEVVIALPQGDHLTLPKRLREQHGVRREVYEELSNPDVGRSIALLRQVRDYAWYLAPHQEVGSFNRRRALGALVHTASAGSSKMNPSWPDPLLSVGPDDQASFDDALASLEGQIPPDPGIVELIRAQRPDAVLVSPLVHQRYHQTEVVKAARQLGIPSGLLVHSWDNLSNKGRIHVPPDRTYVWNELQRKEAVELHGIDPEAVVAIGAAHWDRFFELQPSLGRDELCSRHGFDPARPIVLYLGSTNDICPDELVVVERWLEAVRGAPGSLRDVNILIRWHPGEAARWLEWTPGRERVSVSQSLHRGGRDLYDDLYHAAAAVGLNTTAQIEASILGKPVYTFSGGELAPGQEGSRHFYYLLKDNDGAVAYAETLAEHVGQLERGVAGDFDGAAIERFCQSFIRPCGLDRPVSPILVDEVLKLAATGRRGRAPLSRLRALVTSRGGR